MVGMVYTCFLLTPHSTAVCPAKFLLLLFCLWPIYHHDHLSFPPGTQDTTVSWCPPHLRHSSSAISLPSIWKLPYIAFWPHTPTCANQLWLQPCVLWWFPLGLRFPLACKPFFPKPAFIFWVCYQIQCVCTKSCIPPPSKHDHPAFPLIVWMFSSQARNHFIFSPYFIHRALFLPSGLSLTYFSYWQKFCVPFVGSHQILSRFYSSLLLISAPSALSATRHPSSHHQHGSRSPNPVVPLSEVMHLKVAPRVKRSRILPLEAKICQENLTR